MNNFIDNNLDIISEKLSIIMPVYNSEKTVLRAIESFIELKIIHDNTTLYIVDDCSTDKTLELIKNFKRTLGCREKNFSEAINILENQQNRGPGVSRNIALSRISSGYIGFLDSDDVLDPIGYFNSFAAGLKESADLIVLNGKVFRGGGGYSQKYDFTRIIDSNGDFTRLCARGELDGACIFYIYSFNLLAKYNIKFETGYYEDIAFTYAHLMLSRRPYISTLSAYTKFDRQGSIVNTISINHIDGLLNALIRVKSEMLRFGFGTYNEFEEDLNYNLRGITANLVMKIISPLADTDRCYGFLTHLQDGLKSRGFFCNPCVVPKTNKDKITVIFLELMSSQAADESEVLYRINKLRNSAKNIGFII